MKRLYAPVALLIMLSWGCAKQAQVPNPVYAFEVQLAKYLNLASEASYQFTQGVLAAMPENTPERRELLNINNSISLLLHDKVNKNGLRDILDKVRVKPDATNHDVVTALRPGFVELQKRLSELFAKAKSPEIKNLVLAIQVSVAVVQGYLEVTNG